jgi:hypothetical protein
VFTVLAKQCHLWTLNYVYQIIWYVSPLSRLPIFGNASVCAYCCSLRRICFIYADALCCAYTSLHSLSSRVGFLANTRLI